MMDAILTYLPSVISVVGILGLGLMATRGQRSSHANFLEMAEMARTLVKQRDQWIVMQTQTQQGFDMAVVELKEACRERDEWKAKYQALTGQGDQPMGE